MKKSRQSEPEVAGNRWHRVLQLSGVGPVSKLLYGLVFFGFLGLYLATLQSGVLPADSGEFQRVAATAGVAHPPGYPLYTMVGWVFSHVPVGPTPAWRVNAFSAVMAAATLTILFATGRELTKSALGGLVAALTLGSATTFWATATKASIRPLTAFFSALCLFALARHSSEIERHNGRPRDRFLILFFLALSLGVTHHPSLVFPGTLYVLYLVIIDPTLLRDPNRWLKPVVAAIPGLLVLGYLPLRGAPGLRTVSGFLDHVLARGFRGDMFALGLLDRLVLLPTLLRFQFNWAVLVGALMGALFLIWRDRRQALLLVGSFLVHLIVTLTYDAPQTVEYAVPAYVSLALVAAVPFKVLSPDPSRILASESAKRSLKRAVSVLRRGVLVILLAVPTANLVAHLGDYLTLAGSRDARAYAENLLLDAPKDAVILSNWHWFTPLRYIQEIEGVRDDVAVDYVAPRGEPLAQTWVRSIEERITKRPVVVVRAFQPEYGALPYSFEPLGEALLVRSEPRTVMPPGMEPLDSVLGGTIRMLGYQLGSREARPAKPFEFTLAWSPEEVRDSEIALFAQLLGPDGRLWSAAEDPRHAPESLSPGGVVVERFVVYPRLHAAPGDYTLVVGAYSSEGRFETTDGSDDLALETLNLRPATTRPVTKHRCLVRFMGGPTLVGVDYEAVGAETVRTYLHWAGPGRRSRLRLMGANGAVIAESRVPSLARGEYATIAVDHPVVPSRLEVLGDTGARRWNLLFHRSLRLPSPDPGERYVPFGDAAVLMHASGPNDRVEAGTEAAVSLRFQAQRALLRDYIVSTSLTGINAGGAWAFRVSHDTVPALGAIPSLKWIRDSMVLDPHRMKIPEDAPPVRVVGSLLLYDHFTQRALPHLDERLDPAVEIGSWRVSQEP